MPTERAHRLQTAAWIAAGFAILALLYLLSPVLTPFLLAFILAYIANPLVEKLVIWRLPRSLAVLLTLVLLLGLGAALAIILIPLLKSEITQIITRLPDIAAGINDWIVPWLKHNLGIKLRLDANSVRQFASDHLSNTGALVSQLLSSLGDSSLMVVSFLATLILTPLLLFYLLQDWPKVVNSIDHAIPRPWHPLATRILKDVDAVLSEFLRGQLLVMLILALYYGLSLWLFGLGGAVPVGILTGLLIFIPYVGYGIGLVLALLVALLQFQGWSPIITVAVIYGLGQILEGFFLTPYLVGERIGLHPMAVIFALLAFGQLFGFAGILLALPASAALLVGLREVKILYLESHFYRGTSA